MDNNFNDILNIFKRLDESAKPVVQENNDFPGYWTGKMSAKQSRNKMVGAAESIEQKLQKQFNNPTDEPQKQKFRVEVTVSDPNHTMVTQRNELKRRVCKVTATDENNAVDTAIHWYKKQGYKVHDHHFIGADEQSLTEFGANGIGATPGTQAANPAADAKELQATTQALQKLGAATGTKIPVAQTAKSMSSDAPPSPADNVRNAMVAKQIEPLLTDPAAAGKLTSLIKQQQTKPHPPGAE